MPSKGFYTGLKFAIESLVLDDRGNHYSKGEASPAGTQCE